MSGRPPGGGEGRREVAAFFTHASPAWRPQTPVPWWKSLAQPRGSSGVPQRERPPAVVDVCPLRPVGAGQPPEGTRWEPGPAACVPTPFGAYEPGPYSPWSALADRDGWVSPQRRAEERADSVFRLACALLAAATVLVGAALVAVTHLAV